MAKFIFMCRCCGKKFKEKANTLQTARDRLILRIDGEKRGDDQGIICGECCYKIKLEEYDCDYGTVIDDW